VLGCGLTAVTAPVWVLSITPHIAKRHHLTFFFTIAYIKRTPHDHPAKMRSLKNIFQNDKRKTGTNDYAGSYAN
jgi:hypothetical protein